MARQQEKMESPKLRKVEKKNTEDKMGRSSVKKINNETH